MEDQHRSFMSLVGALILIFVSVLIKSQEWVTLKLNADYLHLHFPACGTKVWLNMTLIKPISILFCFVLFTVLAVLH